MRVLDLGSPEVEVGIKRLNNAKVKFPQAALDIELHFGIHGSAEDVDPQFGDTLQTADIFALEQVGWAPETRKLTQALAEGDTAALKELDYSVYGMQKGFWHQMHRAIFNSQVLMHHPDVPKGHALAIQHDRATEEAGTVAGILLLKDLSTATLPPAPLESLTKRLFTIYNKREKYILEHFFPAAMPERENVKIVGFFGILHKGIALVLAREAAKQGRSDIRITVNETASISEVYEDFLQQRPFDADAAVAFLTHRPD